MFLFPTGYLRGACKIAGINYEFLCESNPWLTYQKGDSVLKSKYKLTEAGFLESFDQWDDRFGATGSQRVVVAGGIIGEALANRPLSEGILQKYEDAPLPCMPPARQTVLTWTNCRIYFRTDSAGEPVAWQGCPFLGDRSATSISFVLVEIFTTLAQIPGHMNHLTYFFAGLEGHTAIARWMTVSAFTALAALVLLTIPQTRKSEPWLALACCGVALSLWIGKGLGPVTGFVPSPWRSSPIIRRRDRTWPLQPESGRSDYS